MPINYLTQHQHQQDQQQQQYSHSIQVPLDQQQQQQQHQQLHIQANEQVGPVNDLPPPAPQPPHMHQQPFSVTHKKQQFATPALHVPHCQQLLPDRTSTPQQQPILTVLDSSTQIPAVTTDKQLSAMAPHLQQQSDSTTCMYSALDQDASALLLDDDVLSILSSVSYVDRQTKALDYCRIHLASSKLEQLIRHVHHIVVLSDALHLQQTGG